MTTLNEKNKLGRNVYQVIILLLFIKSRLSVRYLTWKLVRENL